MRLAKMWQVFPIFLGVAGCLLETRAVAQPTEAGGIIHIVGNAELHPKPSNQPYFVPQQNPNCPPAPCIPTTPVNPPTMDPNTMTPTPTDQTPNFADLASGAGVGSSAALATPGGYLDNAIPMNNFRIRYDQGFNMNRPDRAEFLYPAWREISFHPHGILNEPGVFKNKIDRGVDSLPGRVDFQEVSGYLEFAVNNRASAFVEVPLRSLTMSGLFNEQEDDGQSGGFEPNDGHEAREANFNRSAGLGDIIVGFKYALIAQQCRYLTFQFRTFLPTGDADLGLGTGHYSFEPGLLYYQRVGERLSFQAQVKDWIPSGGNRNVFGSQQSFAGNVLSYGLGVGYDIFQGEKVRVTPITEFVGWSVLNGFQTRFSETPFPLPFTPDNHAVEDVSGTNIVNGKIGVRAYIGEHDDIYLGYGRALTGSQWYKEIVRLEYRRKW